MRNLILALFLTIWTMNSYGQNEKKEYVRYHPNGQESEIISDNGKTMERRTSDTEGKTIEQTKESNGKKEYIKYHPNGQESEIISDNGKTMERRTFDTEGNILELERKSKKNK